MKAGWKTVSLGEVCEILDSKRRPVTKADRRSGPYPYFGATGIQDHVDQFIFDEPLVLLGEDGAKWKSGDRSSFKISGKTWVNNHAHVLRPRRDVILDDWLVYWLNHSDLTDFVTGVTVPKLNQANMVKIPIPLPPLAEQKRIVALLDEAFAGIDEAKAKAEEGLTQLKELSDSSSEVMVNKETQNLTLRPLRDMCEGVFTGPFGTILHKHDYITGGIPLVNPAHINNEGITPSPNKTVSRETAKRLKSYLLKKGDVVIGRRGEMGRCAEITDIEDGWLCGTGSFFIRLYPTCNPRYLVILLKSRSVREKLDGMAKGATIANLGSNDLADLELPFPPMEIQQNIVSRVDALNHEIRTLDCSLTKRAASMDTLKSSILAQAFAGELTA